MTLINNKTLEDDDQSKFSTKLISLKSKVYDKSTFDNKNKLENSKTAS